MSTDLWLGLITGIVFGALLQIGRVARFEKQIGALLLKDMTIFKFMLSAIIVGMIGINLLVGLELVPLSIKATAVGANLVGGIVFGIGWAIVGYCPGTSVAALGEGRTGAIWAILGMLTGAAIYAESTPLLANNILSWGKYGKITLATVLGVSPWIVIILLTICFIALFAFFEKKNI